MKNRILPFSLLVLLSALLFSFTYITSTKSDSRGNDQANKAASYFAKIRNNQHTGLLDVRDVMKAKQQIARHHNEGRSFSDMGWQVQGPDNYSGRTRAIIWSNQDPQAKTIFTGGVTGGIWKSTTAGLTWKKINGENNLFITCFTQDANGTVYAGTGEWFNANEYSEFGKYGYQGGLAGSGIYYSTDGENFNPVADGAQQTDPDWAFINEIAYDDVNGRLFAATNSGLKYSNNGGDTWNIPEFAIDSTFYVINSSYTIQCDSFEVDGDEVILYNPDTTAKTIDTASSNNIRHTMQMEGFAMEVQTSSDGSVISLVFDPDSDDSYTFLYQNGNDFIFENKASDPKNPYFIVKDSLTKNTTLNVTHGNDTSYQHIIVEPYDEYEGTKHDLPTDAGRIEYAFAPSDPSIVYASAVQSNGDIHNIYRSDDKGNNWRIILPGESTIEIFDGQGIYANTIAVKPNDPDLILVGGTNMWEGIKVNEDGYFNWLQKSNSYFSPYSSIYCSASHHNYAFRPKYNDEVLIGTNSGIYMGLINPTIYDFEPTMREYMTTQFYTVAPSGSKHVYMGGAQDNGTIRIDGTGNSELAGLEIWDNIVGLPHGGIGGYCAISLINPDVQIYSDVEGTPAFRRSEDAAENYSSTDFYGNVNLENGDFLIPAILWESFNDKNSRDSIWFHADKDYFAEETIQARSKNWGYPFYYKLEQDLIEGDSILLKDLVQSKFFLGANDHIWMTISMHDFTQGLVWWELANTSQTEYEGMPSCMGLSSDANHLYVGTLEGKLFRISNMALAFSEETADCNSEKCIVSTKYLPIIDPSTGEEITQAITSVAVDPQNPAHIVVTLGNYGNENYVFKSTNAIDSLPEFKSIQGNLPQMPAYSSLIEMSNSDLVFVGTEHGVYSSTTTNQDDPEWINHSDGIGTAPVMMIRQQLVKKAPDAVPLWDGVDTIWEHYPGTNNFGVIYAATYGRGLFRTDEYLGIDDPENIINKNNFSINIYPNPVKDRAKVVFELKRTGNVIINTYDINGKKVQQKEFNSLKAGRHEIECKFGYLPKGAYIMQLITNKKSATGKFIVLE